MNREALKEIVLQHMTPDEVKAFGDKRLKETWQKAYDSLTIEEMAATVVAMPMNETTINDEVPNSVTEPIGTNTHPIITSLLLVLHVVLVVWFLTPMLFRLYVVPVYHRVKSMTTRLLDDFSYSLFCLILDY